MVRLVRYIAAGVGWRPARGEGQFLLAFTSHSYRLVLVLKPTSGPFGVVLVDHFPKDGVVGFATALLRSYEVARFTRTRQPSFVDG